MRLRSVGNCGFGFCDRARALGRVVGVVEVLTQGRKDIPLVQRDLRTGPQGLRHLPFAVVPGISAQQVDVSGQSKGCSGGPGVTSECWHRQDSERV